MLQLGALLPKETGCREGSTQSSCYMPNSTMYEPVTRLTVLGLVVSRLRLYAEPGLIAAFRRSFEP